MRNPFKAQPVTQKEIRAFRSGRASSGRVARASAQQGTGRRKSLAAQSAAYKKQQAKQQRKQS